MIKAPIIYEGAARVASPTKRKWISNNSPSNCESLPLDGRRHCRNSELLDTNNVNETK